MSTFCLTKDAVDRFKQALKSGEITPALLKGLTTSEARRELLGKYIGPENAKEANALFESRMLLKGQKDAYTIWAMKLTGVAPEIKRDFLSKVEKLDKLLTPSEQEQFLGDMISKRLGLEINQKDAKVISDLSTNLRNLKAVTSKDGTFPSSADRAQYGASKVALETYVNDLKLKIKSDSQGTLDKMANFVKELPGAMKSSIASLDNSFWGRQGIKTLLDVRTSHIWVRNFVKSFGDIGKSLIGKDAIAAIKADIYSRPNAINGKYDAGGYGLTALTEEAYPSSLPEKIPLLGTLFKASEAAYNGAALRLRADLADRLIRVAEKQGINTLDKTQAEGMGNLISSLTGRGSLGKAEPLSKEINNMFFSVKFLKSNFDTLTAHQFDPKATGFTKAEAAKNLLSMTATVASVLTMASILDPNSVDKDPRSTNFGKIKIFGNWTDITGGMAGLVTLASRLVPTEHDGQLSWWSKNSKGAYVDLHQGGFGSQTALDVFDQFWQGKLSPIAGVFRDVLKGTDYSGNKVTPLGELQNVTVPLGIQNYEQLQSDPNSSNALGSLILDGLGLSVSTKPAAKAANWNDNPTKELLQFKQAVGDSAFEQANQTFNTQYNEWVTEVESKSVYKNLSDKGKQDLLTKGKQIIEKSILDKHNFTYKKEDKTDQQKSEKDIIDQLVPQN